MTSKSRVIPIRLLLLISENRTLSKGCVHQVSVVTAINSPLAEIVKV